jgi:hypothetical protein
LAATGPRVGRPRASSCALAFASLCSTSATMRRRASSSPERRRYRAARTPLHQACAVSGGGSDQSVGTSPQRATEDPASLPMPKIGPTQVSLGVELHLASGSTDR